MISRFESGVRGIKMDMQFALMRALGIWPGEFFSPPGQPSTDAVAANASPERRADFVNFAKPYFDGGDRD